MVLAGGAEQPRDLPIPGRELDGVHFAMEFLPLQNKRVAGDAGVPELWATGKHVVIIGGGDTGSDCVGTSNRHGAKSVTQFELLPMPPDVERNPVWPYWPTRLRTSSSHEEGVSRDWSIATKEFIGEGGKVESAEGGAAGVEGRQAERGAGLRVRDARRPGAARDGLRLAAAVAARGVRRGARRARQRQSDRPKGRALTPPRCRRSSPPATCAAASRSWCGRSAKAASARARSTNSSWGFPSCRASRAGCEFSPSRWQAGSASSRAPSPDSRSRAS